MSNSEMINAMLHSVAVPHLYTARAGDYVKIELPKVPLTRYTEFVRLDTEKSGDTGCFAELEPPDAGEGTLLPQQIVGRAICPGRLHIVLRAVDIFSGAEIPDVTPLDIVVEVKG
jgi:hypothetical protein